MEREEFLEKVKKENIRNSAWRNTFEIAYTIINTDIGRAIILDDMEDFQRTYEKILASDYDEVKIDDFLKLKILQNRILLHSKRISEYLKLEKAKEKQNASR